MTLTNEHSWIEICELFTKRLTWKTKKDAEDFKAWMLTKEQFGVLFDEKMYKRVWKIQKDLKNDYDSFTVMLADPGTGKSVFGMQICALMSPSFRLSNIAYNYRSLAIGLKETQKYDSVDIDEGALILHSADRSKQGSKLEQLSAIMRQFNLHILICMTDLLLLRRHFRDMRIDTLIYLRGRGKYRLYTGKAIKLILELYKYKHGDILAIKVPNGTFFDGYFNHVYPVINNVNKESYLGLKQENGREFIEDLYADAVKKEEKRIVPRTNLIPIIEATASLPVSQETFRKYIQLGTLKGAKIASKYFVDRDSLAEFTKSYQFPEKKVPIQ
jgi:hypothetical protein